MALGSHLNTSSSSSSPPSAPSCGNPNDFETPNPPTDSVSCLEWSPMVNYLAVGSWDNTIRIYEASGDKQVHERALFNYPAPVLCFSWSKDGDKVVAGSADSAAYLQDLRTGQCMQAAAHDAPISKVKWLDIHNGVFATGSWDKTIKLWDTRTPQPILTIPLPERCYAMDVSLPIMVVGCADGKINIYNLAEPSKVCMSQDSPFKYQIRSIACFPSAEGFVLGGHEARVSVEFFDDNSKSYTFSCHRRDGKTSKEQLVFAINAISFHPTRNAFSTAGSDGGLLLWDVNSRSRLYLFKRGNTPITSTAFNRDGNLFAYAYSYDWHRGYLGNAPSMETKVMIHKFLPSELTVTNSKSR